ncbi:excalibur calcium-binding domain-containing protein [bacterium]|nr:excalibur calcium-binding domain-containing protein [bacterium]
MFAILTAPLSLEAAAPVFKCANNGSVTYQSNPCPSGVRKDAPTAEKLNAERKKKLSQVVNRPPTSATSSTGGELTTTSSGTSGSNSQSEKERPQAGVALIASPTNLFKCDGRIHCSQMTSCSEAKYFLSRCPGVKMDGDGDGIPCEDQLCNR